MSNFRSLWSLHSLPYVLFARLRWRGSPELRGDGRRTQLYRVAMTRYNTAPLETLAVARSLGIPRNSLY